MAWSFSADQLAALSGSHEMVVQVDVFNSAGVWPNVPIAGGTVSATLMSDVCRSGSLTVARRLVDQGLFDPRRDRVRIQTGPAGFPLIPIFTGRVQDVSDADSGQVQVQVEDFGKDLVDASFEQPWQTQSGQLVAAEMRRIIQDVNPLFGLDSSRAVAAFVPNGLAWEESRGEALDKLASGINCIWQSDRTGSFVLYPNPYYALVPPRRVLDLSDGPGGTLTSYVENRTRDKVYNSVTLQVERADNAPPVRVTVRDTQPGSPYRWGGEYGKVNRVVRLQTPQSGSMAQDIGRRILVQSLALARSVRLSTPHFPLLDPGDVIGVSVRGTVTAHVIESITYPLEALNATSIAARELRLMTQEDPD